MNGSSGLVRILLPSCVYDANQSDEVGGLLEVGGNGTAGYLCIVHFAAVLGLSVVQLPV